jgi:hypothetical protein
MTEYAEAACATCHAIRTMNQMKEVKVKRIVGKSYQSGSSTGRRKSNSNSYSKSGMRHGSGNSTSSRQRSSSKTQMSVYREWVCKGCSAPKSDMSPTLRNAILYLLVGTALLAFCTLNPRQAGKRQTDVNEGSQTNLTKDRGASPTNEPSVEEQRVVTDPTSEAPASKPVRTSEIVEEQVMPNPQQEPTIIFQSGTGE